MEWSSPPKVGLFGLGPDGGVESLKVGLTGAHRVVRPPEGRGGGEVGCPPAPAPPPPPQRTCALVHTHHAACPAVERTLRVTVS